MDNGLYYRSLFLLLRAMVSAFVFSFLLLSGCGSPTKSDEQASQVSTETGQSQQAGTANSNATAGLVNADGSEIAPIEAARALEFNTNGEAAALLEGKALYEQQCSSCHGQAGSGALSGSLDARTCVVCRNVETLKSTIEATMPLGDPEQCIGDCASLVADYINTGFPTDEQLDIERVSTESVSGVNDTRISEGEGDATIESTQDDSQSQEQPQTQSSHQGKSAESVMHGLRRLTAFEYDNTLRDLLEDERRAGAARLPVDAGGQFGNGFETQVASKVLIDGLEQLAEDAVDRLLSDTARRNRVLRCEPSEPTDRSCLLQIIRHMGVRLLRRPISDVVEEGNSVSELNRYVDTFMPLADASDDFYEAVRGVLTALLQHPEFIYRVEFGLLDGEQSNGMAALSDWEVASRLSYLLWGSPPDERLRSAARKGQLTTAEQIKEMAETMFRDPRAETILQRFFSQWLNYESVVISDDPLKQAMQIETEALVKRIVFDEQRSWRALFEFGETYINAQLADHYGLDRPDVSNGFDWVPYDIDRAGILSHGSFLSNGAHGDDTSPTMRGIAIRELLMCQTIPDPPPGVNVDVPPMATEEAKCKEERYQQHAEGDCAGCHSLVDPIGFGLERYDALGRYREVEANEPTCTIEGNGALGAGQFFSGPKELAALLLEGATLERCFVSQFYRFAMGRSELDAADQAWITHLTENLVGASDSSFKALLLELVVADAFRFRDLDG